jgi:hypothetical protein
MRHHPPEDFSWMGDDDTAVDRPPDDEGVTMVMAPNAKATSEIPKDELRFQLLKSCEIPILGQDKHG